MKIKGTKNWLLSFRKRKGLNKKLNDLKKFHGLKTRRKKDNKNKSWDKFIEKKELENKNSR